MTMTTTARNESGVCRDRARSWTSSLVSRREEGAWAATDDDDRQGGKTHTRCALTWIRKRKARKKSHYISQNTTRQPGVDVLATKKRRRQLLYDDERRKNT